MQLNVNATLEDNLRFALRDGLSIFLDEAKAAPLFHHKNWTWRIGTSSHESRAKASNC